jgi:hypothetical protein
MTAEATKASHEVIGLVRGNSVLSHLVTAARRRFVVARGEGCHPRQKSTDRAEARNQRASDVRGRPQRAADALKADPPCYE